MACRRLVELPKVAFQRHNLQPITRSYFPVSLTYKEPALLTSTQCRCVSTKPIINPAVKPAVPEIPNNFFTRMRKRMGLPDYTQAFYRAMGLFIYEKIDSLAVSDILTEFELEDTFYSWYLMMELHVWMLMSRAGHHPKEGRIVKEGIGNAMWEDVRRRMKLVDPTIPMSEQQKTLNNLDAELQFAVVLYDEAMLSGDTRLAEALWVRLYRGQEVDPILLEKVVCYVRQQMRHLELTPREEIILKANYTWLPLKKCRI